MKYFFYVSIILLSISNKSYPGQNDCTWNNQKKIKCIEIKNITSNSSQFTESSINKFIITRDEISNVGATDLADILKIVPSINLTQSGPRGQQASIFIRGAGSNHVLVMINGIPINDSSTTQGLHDFGVDFIQTIEQIEIYPGSSGTHFGSNAIGGAINIILSGDLKDTTKLNFDKKNNFDFLSNKIFTNDNFLANLKLGVVKNETKSATSDNNEKDKVENYSGNLNIQKWISPNLELFNTSYLRKTITEYDTLSSVNNQGDNIMFTNQIGFKRKTKNSQNFFTTYINRYNRKYNENGTIDTYEGNSGGVKLDYSKTQNQKFSFGSGFHYNYDWAEFDNKGSYTSSTKGNLDNFALYGNFGFNFSKNDNISFFIRNDNHKQTGSIVTYKMGYNKKISSTQLGLSRMTGLRNPTLYELYGTDNYGYSGNPNLNAEKSLTNEAYIKHEFNKNLLTSLRVFKTNIQNNIEYLDNRYVNSIDKTSLTQKGIENQINFNFKLTNFNFYSTILSSKKKNGEDQLRRPHKVFGFNLSRKIINKYNNNIYINLNYKHYGQHLDTHYSAFNTIKMSGTDIFNLILKKKYNNKEFFIKIDNLLNKKYERPHGYNQDSRIIKFGLSY